MHNLSKRIFIVILLFLIAFVSIPVQATDFGGASYIVDERIAENDLPFNINHFTELGRSGISSLSKQQVNVLDIPASSEIKIVPWSKLGASKWTMTTVRSMAEDFENDNPGYKVLAGINGDFFDISGTQNLPYATVGPHVSMGHYYKITDTPSTTRNPIGFKNDGSTKPIVGNVPYAVSDKMKLTIYGELDTVLFEIDIDKINQEPGTNETALYYANWDEDRKIIPMVSPEGYVVENATHALAFSTSDFYGIGSVTRKISKTLYEGEFSIVSNHSEVSQLLDNNPKVRVQYEFAGAYEGIENATGAGKPIIYDGVFMPDTTDFGIARHPRTMIGSKSDGSIVMVVVDGRQTDMTGVSQQEMGAILHHYGCVDAYNLDGGGSSTMMILDDGEFVVTNSPSDGRERSDSNCLLVVVKVPIIDFEPIQILENQITISAPIADLNGYSFTDLYVKCNNEMKKVENNQVTFTNLESNTPYSYEFYYKEGEIYTSLIVQSKIATAKTTPFIDFIEVEKIGEDIAIKIELFDSDIALTRYSIELNGQSKVINNNQVVFYDFNQEINTVVLKYSYDLNDGNGRVDIVDSELAIKCNLSIFMQLVFGQVENIANGIFQ